MIISVDEAAEIIIKGGVAAFPTETVYGLGADAKNIQAIQKIFDLKGRPSDNPLIVHVSHSGQVSGLALEIPELFHTLSKAFWPGPLTMVLKKLPSVPDQVSAGLATVAVRMPDHPLALQLIDKTGPLTAPSANKSGRPSPTKPSHITDDYGGLVPVVDGGNSQIGIESTVLDLTSEPPVILRPGAVSKAMIENTINKKLGPLSLHATAENIKSPGIKYTHYKPKASVKWIDKPPIKIDQKSYYIFNSPGNAHQQPNVISFENDFNAMARSLYDHFRTADHLGYTQILVEKLPNGDPHPLISPLKNRISKAVSL